MAGATCLGFALAWLWLNYCSSGRWRRFCRLRRSGTQPEQLASNRATRGDGKTWECLKVIGWDAGIRTPITCSRGAPKHAGDLGSCRFCLGFRSGPSGVSGGIGPFRGESFKFLSSGCARCAALDVCCAPCRRAQRGHPRRRCPQWAARWTPTFVYTKSCGGAWTLTRSDAET